MLSNLVLAWTLVVQVQVQLCQNGVCRPHPTLPDKTQIVRTVATESECLLLQMDLQRAIEQRGSEQRSQPQPPEQPGRRYAHARTHFTCQATY
jgi:hypothetical protein